MLVWNSLHLWTWMILYPPIEGLRLSGVMDTDDFYVIAAKFGGQRVEKYGVIKQSMYIYGNANFLKLSDHDKESSSSVHDQQNKLNAMFTLVVVEKDLFLNLYQNKSMKDLDKACNMMMSEIGKLSLNEASKNSCESGNLDLLRSLPCQDNTSCYDQPENIPIVPGFQFTMERDSPKPTFYFVTIVACKRMHDSCKWQHTSSQNLKLDYDIWIVNGNPYSSHNNLFKYQFSYEQQDHLEIYLTFLGLYFILVPMQVYAAFHQKHYLTKLFTAALCLEPVGIMFNVIHFFIYAFNGVGVEPLAITGDFIDILSECIFMLILLLLAKGWPITKSEISWKPVLICIWILYMCIHFILHVWKLTEIDIIEDIDEYQTLPGWLIIGFRIILMGWFLAELRNTMISENDYCKIQFYLHFGAGILIYFIYLPVVALIALYVSPMMRQKLLLGMTYSSDFLAFAITANLLWPTRSEQYFQLAPMTDMGDELEEFNEAPHNVKRPSEC